MLKRKHILIVAILLCATVLVVFLVPGVCSAIRRTIGMETYNQQDAQLVRKIALAVEKNISPAEIEDFVGKETLVNTWREELPVYCCLQVCDDTPWWRRSEPTGYYSATKVMTWQRPVDESETRDKGPRIVGIAWDQDGKAKVLMAMICTR